MKKIVSTKIIYDSLGAEKERFISEELLYENIEQILEKILFDNKGNILNKLDLFHDSRL